MNSIRAKFIRGEEVKYISHLDLMRAFERAVRRSRIPISYTEGFNPHPKMVFGLPLSVGVTSESEYADFVFAQHIESYEFMNRLNEQLPEGLKIVRVQEKKDNNNIMASIVKASYNIYVCTEAIMGINQMKSFISRLMSITDIVTKKKTKKGVRDINIRPMIYEMKVEEVCNIGSNYGCTGKVFCIDSLVAAGSRGNLKPSLIVDALNELANAKIECLKVHRTGLLIEKNGQIANPID